MGFKLAELFVDISAKGLGGLHSSLNGLMNPLNLTKTGLAGVSGMADMARSSLLALTGPVAGLAAALGSASAILVGIGAVAAGGLFATKLAAGAETATVALTTMLGSAEKAKEVMADVTQFAAETPFELPELNDATRKLLAFGTAADDLLPTLRMVGDVSSGIQAPLGEIAEIYGKAQVQGRLFAEDINQLTGRGIPIIGELAKQFGVTEGAVRKLVESGQVNFGHLQTAFRNLTSEGGKFHDMMAAQSKTGAGLWSTMMDGVKGLARDFGGALLPAAKDVMSAMIGLFNEAGDGLAPFKTIVGDVAQLFSSGLVGAINLARESMPFVGAAAEVIGAQFTALREIVSMVGASLWDLSEPVRNLLPTAASLGASLMDALDTLKFFWENWDTFLLIGVEHVKLFGINTWNQLKNLLNNGVQLVIWFGNNWKEIMLATADIVLGILENLGQNIRKFWSAVLEFLKGNGWQKPIMDGLLDGTQAALDRIVSKMPNLTKAQRETMTAELGRLYDELGKADAEFQRKKQERHADTQSRAKGSAAGSASAAAAEVAGSKESKLGFYGLTEFARMVQTGVNPAERERAAREKKMLDAQQQTAANTKAALSSPRAAVFAP